VASRQFHFSVRNKEHRKLSYYYHYASMVARGLKERKRDINITLNQC
jgi:hypothetical protein